MEAKMQPKGVIMGAFEFVSLAMNWVEMAGKAGGPTIDHSTLVRPGCFTHSLSARKTAARFGTRNATIVERK
jgi:hypothetical protein